MERKNDNVLEDNTADTKVSGEARGESASGAKTEIPLQPIGEGLGKAGCCLAAHHGGPSTGVEIFPEEIVTLSETCAEAGSWQDL